MDEAWFDRLVLRVVAQASAPPAAADQDLELFIADLAFDDFVAPAPPQRPRAASPFYPIWGVPIPPLAADEPCFSTIILPFDERSQQETEDELNRSFDGLFY